MPVYEYSCRNCGAKASLFFRAYSAVSQPSCPHCGSQDLRRLVSLVADMRGEEEGFDHLQDSDAGMGEWDQETREMVNEDMESFD